MEKKFIIAPSILSANFAKLGEEVESVLDAGADWVHFDVMDNHYVPNLTIGPLVCKALKSHGIKAPIDVHLMVKPVDNLIEDFAKAGANVISFHPEASNHVDRSVELIKKNNCKVGIALNPATPLSVLDHLWEKIDLILIMTVNPGFGGQSFINEMMEKIEKTRKLIKQTGRPIRLEVDGGVKIDNIAKIAEAGADTFVMGSAIFNPSNYPKTLADILAELAKVH